MSGHTPDSGAHPMRPAPSAADTEDMTVLAVTYDTRLGRFGRRRDGDQDTGQRRSDAQDDGVKMDLDREMYMQEIRERIERDAYDVDPDAVAGAIVERLLAASRGEREQSRRA
jgi:hypothetical protein